MRGASFAVSAMSSFFAHNVHSLTAAGFATCEVQRSETQQVAKPADVQADVTATIINKIVIKK